MLTWAAHEFSAYFFGVCAFDLNQAASGVWPDMNLESITHSRSRERGMGVAAFNQFPNGMRTIDAMTIEVIGHGFENNAAVGSQIQQRFPRRFAVDLDVRYE
jgi:hypothetical protein